MMQKLKGLESQGLSASIYTQPFDVESEQNGLVTYDREVIKIPLRELRRINGALNRSAHKVGDTIGDLPVRDADLTAESERYGILLARYRAGDHQTESLRHLALMAARLGDQTTATEAGNEFIRRLKGSYTKNDWMFVSEVTRTSKDKGFELFRAAADQANATLGPHMAERRVREIIKREEIDPYISEAGPAPDWEQMAKRIAAQDAAAAREMAYKAAMLFYLKREEWAGYGKYFVAYFGTLSAQDQFSYSIVPLSRMLAEHVFPTQTS